MTEEKFIKKVIAERIDMLLQKAEAEIRNDDDIVSIEDDIFQGLEEERSLRLRNYLDQLKSLEPERGEALYLGGVCDGIRLMVKIDSIGRAR